jgi:hypothetical protein
MHTGKLVFSQMMDFLPRNDFDKCVRRYRGNRRTRGFSCRDQFLAMAFAQLTYRESLRDIETCLRSVEPKLYHMGFRGRISRSTIADANHGRDWRIYADFAQTLISRARMLYADEPFGVDLKGAAYALDSTTIDLCLSLFPWATFRRRKGAVKLHTLIDLRGNIPCFIRVSHGKTHDVNILDELPIEPGAFYIMDKAYVDFTRLYRLHQQSAFFLTRAKSNLNYKRQQSCAIEKATGLRSDQTIVLAGAKSSQSYPEPLRRIHYFDIDTEKRFVFLTNNHVLPALTIAQLYKCRWQIELFFKWIKQHLRIKSFYGTSANAVRTQVWIAISVYVFVAIIKKELKIDRSLSEILQILSVNPFEKTPVFQLLTHLPHNSPDTPNSKQLPLFDL